MGSISDFKGHVLCLPFPLQGHINPMFKLAKILHHKGFFITFVNTEYIHKRLLRSIGPSVLDGFPGFRFETISDGLPFSDADVSQDVISLTDSIYKNCLVPLCSLLSKLNDTTSSNEPPVTSIVSDGVMSFTLDAAEKFGIPNVLFWTPSACGFLSYMHYRHLVERGLTPLKDASDLTNGYLETEINWIPGMKYMRLRDLPSFMIRTTEENDIGVNLLIRETQRTPRASAVVLNTFDTFEEEVLDALSSLLPRIYTIGPLLLLADQIKDDRLKSLGSNLWKEQPGCLEWLNTKEPNSVVFVNFGSTTVMTPLQLTEFASGLGNSGKSFLWIIRPDLVVGDSTMLPLEFVTQTKDRGMLASWCAQEQVLKHPSIAGFLTHSGWNSMLESVCGGVPMICWPFLAEQHTNCRYCCTEWGIGIEIDSTVRQDEVEKQVRELMEGDKGKEMKKKAMEWKTMAEEAAKADGSSSQNLERLISDILLATGNM